MKKNIIILTAGLSGSSVLTSLISSSENYWTGEKTVKKTDYDTYENMKLVEFNNLIIEKTGYKGDYTREFSSHVTEKISEDEYDLDMSAINDFLNENNKNSPWIWKDPRLWMTIRFWSKCLNLNDVKFIVLTREDKQTWISQILRRRIQSYGHCKKYHRRIYASLIEFLNNNELDYHDVCYEDLLVHSKNTICSLNDFLNTSLTVKDLEKVFHGKLGKKNHGFKNFIKAVLIYIKNYREAAGRYSS